MIRIPHVYVANVKTYANKRVNRLIIAHPKSIQYIQHDPDCAEMRIRYISGDELTMSTPESPEVVKKAFEDLVYQIKDCSD
jgi:hypothetical protein